MELEVNRLLILIFYQLYLNIWYFKILTITQISAKLFYQVYYSDEVITS